MDTSTVGDSQRLELTDTGPTAVQSEFKVGLVRNSLTVLLNGEPWTDEPLGLASTPGVDLDPGHPAELSSRRPDLRAAELRLRASLTNIGVVARSYYPAITLTADVSGASSEFRNVVSNLFGTLGAGLVLPFLRWNEMSLNVEIASADYEIAANAYRHALYSLKGSGRRPLRSGPARRTSPCA